MALVMAPASLLGGFLVGPIDARVLRAVVVTKGASLAIWYLVR
jgi:hypothetical protein